MIETDTVFVAELHLQITPGTPLKMLRRISLKVFLTCLIHLLYLQTTCHVRNVVHSCRLQHLGWDYV